MTPSVLCMPSVPRSDTRLAALEGPQSESPVWEPSAVAANDDATATAEPPEEPIELLDGSNAFQTCPNALELKCPSLANSDRLDLPMMIAPASRSLATSHASLVGW